MFRMDSEQDGSCRGSDGQTVQEGTCAATPATVTRPAHKGSRRGEAIVIPRKVDEEISQISPLSLLKVP